MGIFSSYETVFLKEDSEASLFINKMEALLERADGTCKKEIDKQIKIARYGLAGEEKISFELKNSEMDNYKSIVCLANPKTILNDKYAKKEVKEKVVRADQLIAHIKKLEKESKNGTFTKNK